jgi:hypothetical protein
MSTDQGTDAQTKTPAYVLDRLSRVPGAPPVGFRVIAEMTMGQINTGDVIGIDYRWCPVVLSTSVRHCVTVETAYGYPGVTAHEDVPIYLARRPALDKAA